METIRLLSLQTLLMFLFAGVGFILFKTGKISQEGSKSLGNILICAVLPCVIVKGFLVERTPERTTGLLISLGAAAVAVYGCAGLYRRAEHPSGDVHRWYLSGSGRFQADVYPRPAVCRFRGSPADYPGCLSAPFVADSDRLAARKNGSADCGSLSGRLQYRRICPSARKRQRLRRAERRGFHAVFRDYPAASGRVGRFVVESVSQRIRPGMFRPKDKAGPWVPAYESVYSLRGVCG